jgi:DNA-binding IclR family transcriptional regulator
MATDRSQAEGLGEVEFDDERHAEDRQFVRALARGLEILRCFQPQEPLLGNRELAHRTGLPKPTVARLTHTLVTMGLLEFLPNHEKYRLRSSVLALGYAAAATSEIVELARPIMQRVVDEHGGSFALGVRDRLSMICLIHCHSKGIFTLRMDVGSHVPMLPSAMGRGFLVGLPEHERQFLVDRLARVWRRGGQTTQEIVNRALEEFRAQGFCTSYGEWLRDILSIGAPVISHDRQVVLGLTYSAFSYATARATMNEVMGPQVRQVAAVIGDEITRLRWRP